MSFIDIANHYDFDVDNELFTNHAEKEINGYNFKKKLSVIRKFDFIIMINPSMIDLNILFKFSAYGIPSIVNYFDGVNKIIDSGKNGYILPSEYFPSRCAELIINVYNDEFVFNRLVISTINVYKNKFKWKLIIEKINVSFKNIFKQLIVTNNKLFNWLYLPTYIINLPERTERKRHIEEQFKGKPEFDLIWVEACRHPIGRIGLWLSIVKIINIAKENNEDLIVICEDDHCFTRHYSKENLFKNIITAYKYNVELLSGGIGGFGTALPVNSSLFWINWYWSNQFIVIYKSAYQHILDYKFNDNDTADGVLSNILSKKMTIWPFYSTQRNFGYSDVTAINMQNPDRIEEFFKSSDMRLAETFIKYKISNSDDENNS
ncbi:hypothetical protein [Alistipes sp. ZOR0009]|uniref:hypothetical protein n=1 Tax=Alistipes sp. ZOR0009 TaxID=1339253 RepID=UPI001E5545E2|nr:hypothetical protein [Alistipes sp. ZOR0009]